MGTNIKSMIDPVKKDMDIKSFLGKTIAIDAYNAIYQFLTTIKGNDGKPLTNIYGNITSHISGLLYRNVMLLENNIKPIYCFDGLDKSLKYKWENSKNNPSKHNYPRINKEILNSTKTLLDCLGIPYVEGLGEGEAQCSYLNSIDMCFAVASQDYDCFAFGTKRLIRNLAVGSKRTVGNTSTESPIEYISADKFYEYNLIKREQLVDIMILIGSDFFCGLKGYGEKHAVEYIKDYGNIENYINSEDEEYGFDEIPLKNGDTIKRKDFLEILPSLRGIYLDPKVNTDIKVVFSKPHLQKLKSFLCNDNTFSEIRVDKVCERLEKVCFEKKQINLDKFVNKNL